MPMPEKRNVVAALSPEPASELYGRLLLQTDIFFLADQLPIYQMSATCKVISLD